MGKIVNLSLYLITILCIYIILSVGLDLFGKIEFSSNSTNIYQVALNLSYSYIAGLIFYFFISYLPFHIQKKKIKSIIDLKIRDLKNQIESYLQTFSSTTINKEIEAITLQYIKTLINNNSLNDPSFYSNMIGLSLSNYDFIKQTKPQVYQLISSVLFYQKYLSLEQIQILEKIKDSNFFHLEKIYNHPQGKILVDQQNFKEEFINNLWQIIHSLQKFKN